jgi:hypothetical protein
LDSTRKKRRRDTTKGEDDFLYDSDEMNGDLPSTKKKDRSTPQTPIVQTDNTFANVTPSKNISFGSLSLTNLLSKVTKKWKPSKNIMSLDKALQHLLNQLIK